MKNLSPDKGEQLSLTQINLQTAQSKFMRQRGQLKKQKMSIEIALVKEIDSGQQRL